MRTGFKSIIAIAVAMVMCISSAMPVNAKAGKAYVITKQWSKYSPKEKFRKRFEKRYKNNGLLTWYRDYDEAGKHITKYYYGDNNRLIRKKETDRDLTKFWYSNKGRNVTRGEYSKDFKAFSVTTKYKFTKAGRIKEYKESGGDRTKFKYNKKGKLIEVRHYNSKGKLWLKDRAKYNRRGWITRIKNTFYKKGRKPRTYTTYKAKYKVKKKYVYAYERCYDFEEDEQYSYTIKYRKKYKNKMRLGIDPFEMPYLEVASGAHKYKYTFYKKGFRKGLVKTMTERAYGSFEESEKYDYKKVKADKKRLRIQYYLTEEESEENVLFIDSYAFGEFQSDANEE